jgi:hypothetical protein
MDEDHKNSNVNFNTSLEPFRIIMNSDLEDENFPMFYERLPLLFPLMNRLQVLNPDV